MTDVNPGLAAGPPTSDAQRYRLQDAVPGCVDHLGRHLLNGSLDIALAAPVADGRVSGSASLWNLPCTVEGVVRPDGSLVVICAKPVADWAFGEAFPQLPGAPPSVMDLLLVSNPDPDPDADDGVPDFGALAARLEALDMAAPTGFFLHPLGLVDSLLVYAYAPDGLPNGPPADVLATISLWTEFSARDRAAGLVGDGLVAIGTLTAPEALPFATQLEQAMATFVPPGTWAWAEPLVVASVEHDPTPELRVRVPLASGFDFGPMSVSGASIGLVSPIDAVDSTLPADDARFAVPVPSAAQVTVTCTIHVPNGMAGSDAMDLDIEVDLPLEGDIIRGQVALESHQQPFFRPDDHPALPALPDGELDVVVWFDAGERRLERVDLSMQIGKWAALPNIFTIHDLDVTIQIHPFASGPTVVVAIFAADLQLGPVRLDLDGVYPGGSLSGQLDPRSPLLLGDVAEALGLAVPEIPVDLAIENLELQYDFGSSGASGFLRLGSTGSSWPSDVFQDLHLRFSTADDDLEVGATLLIGDLGLTLLARHDGTGWRFEGSTDLGAALQVGAMVDGAAAVVDTSSPSIPDFLRELTFRNLDLVYATEPATFTFDGEMDLDIDGKAVVVTLHVSVGATTAVTGQIVVGGEFFALDLENGPTAGDPAPSDPGEPPVPAGRKAGASESTATLLASYAGSANLHDLAVDLAPDLGALVPAVTMTRASFGYQRVKEGEAAKTAWLLAVSLGMDLDLSSVLESAPAVLKQLVGDDVRLGVDAMQVVVASEPLLASDVTKLVASGFPVPKGDLSTLDLAADLVVGDHHEPLVLKIGREARPITRTTGREVSSSTSSAEPASATDGAAGSQEPAASSASATPAAARATDATAAAPGDGTSWVSVAKHLGPLYVERIGVRYEQGDAGATSSLVLVVAASVSMSGLTLSLDDFSVSNPLDRIHPTFGLTGLGLAFANESMSISGAFLHNELDDSYRGSATIKTKTMTIGAMGGYTTTSTGDPSLFVYAFLDSPLGGPPPFFVTGLAAGFGYNQALALPPIDQVATFPLVRAAAAEGKGAGAADPAAQLEALSPYLSVAPGQTWLAVGVRFTSFGIVRSFAMLTASFGHETQISLLGLSTLSMPNVPDAKEYLGYAQLAVKATILPDRGVLTAEGALTAESYVLSPDCHLTGGFAFYLWFADQEALHISAGDFVFTLGGYHPKFVKPDHYPDVPRLALNWSNGPFSIKGTTYFALTPGSVMAGGALEAVWESGGIRAWYGVDANFLVSWEPFHYDATYAITLGASFRVSFGFFTVSMSASVGVDLHMWGPPFGATATIDMDVISFSISLGAGPAGPTAIAWSDFTARFLPSVVGEKSPPSLTTDAQWWAHTDLAVDAAPLMVSSTDSYCTCRVSGGLVRDLAAEAGPGAAPDEAWVLNGMGFELTVETLLPPTRVDVRLGGAAPLTSEQLLVTGQAPRPVDGWARCETGIQVGPVGIEQLESTFFVLLDRIDEDGVPIRTVDPEQPIGTSTIADTVQANAIRGGAPKALWDVATAMHTDRPDALNGAGLLENTLKGFTLSALAPEEHATPLIEVASILGHRVDRAPGLTWANAAPPVWTPDARSTQPAALGARLRARSAGSSPGRDAGAPTTPFDKVPANIAICSIGATP